MKKSKSKTYSICNLLDGLNIITRNKLVIGIEELDTGFLEGTLGEKESLDTR